MERRGGLVLAIVVAMVLAVLVYQSIGLLAR
jgi:hypothetical protein